MKHPRSIIFILELAVIALLVRSYLYAVLWYAPFFADSFLKMISLENGYWQVFLMSGAYLILQGLGLASILVVGIHLIINRIPRWSHLFLVGLYCGVAFGVGNIIYKAIHYGTFSFSWIGVELILSAPLIVIGIHFIYELSQLRKMQPL